MLFAYLRFQFKHITFSTLVSTLIIIFSLHGQVVSAQSVWQDPGCDPDTDPTLCNMAAPLNVSGSDQTKLGGLTIDGTLVATTAFTFSGLAGSFSVTADSITDSMVRNDITSGKFIGTGSISDAVDLATSEVNGMLPSTSIAEQWVNETGDTMTGPLVINSTAQAIDIDHATAGVYGINIYADTTSSQSGIYIQSASTTSGAYPLSVDVTGLSKRGINVSQASSNGYGIFSASSGTLSTGVYGSGTYAGLYGASTDGVGVYGSTTAVNTDAIIGETSAAGSSGVRGESLTDYGVYGNTAASSGTYGTVGCSNGNNCGRLGGDTLAGLFDGRVAGADYLPLEEERFGDNSFRAMGKWGTVSLNGVAWDNITFMASDGEELWVNHAHPASPYVFRINQAMMTTNKSQAPGSLGFRGATLGSKGLVTIRNSDGEICVWEKAAANMSCPGIPDADLRYTESLWFDGSYYWAGRTGGRGITRFDNTFTLAASQVTASAVGGGVASIIDFTQDETYVYALEDSDTTFAPSASRVMIINRSTNTKIGEFSFSNIEMSALEFDGKYIWAGAITNTGQAGLVRIDPITSQSDFLDFSAVYPTQFLGPKDLVFDGTYLWVVLQDSYMLARVSPQQADMMAPKVIADEFTQFSYEPQRIAFDGEAIWVLENDTSASPKGVLNRFFSGKGYGYQTTTVFPQEGISLWDYTTGDGVCIRVESGTIVAYTGALCN